MPAASTDDCVHAEEFVCLYLEDCEEVELEDADDQVLYYTSRNCTVSSGIGLAQYLRFTRIPLVINFSLKLVQSMTHTINHDHKSFLGGIQYSGLATPSHT